MPAKKILVFYFPLFLVLGAFLFSAKSVVLAGYGEAASAPICGAQKPGEPWLYRVESLETGTVDLHWDKTDRATSWTVAYGIASGQYIYGVHNFGNSDSRSLRISSLPGGTYYFVVRANNDCMPGKFSSEWQVSVSGAGVARITSQAPAVPHTPKVSPTPTSGRGYVPPVEGKEPLTLKATPTPRFYTQPKGPVPSPKPTPTPKPGFLQRIVDFILGLFGAGK